MKIYYDFNKRCAITPPTSVSPFVLVEDDFQLTKVVNVLVGTRQKVNEVGLPLYLKDIMKTEILQVVTGYTETTKSTLDGKDLEPIMIEIQKTDDDDNNLYYTTDEEGNQVETTEVTDNPVMIEVHKTNSAGKELYKKPIIQEVPNVVKVGEQETTEITNNPIMEEVREDKEFNLTENPEYFTITEVLTEKTKRLSEKLGNDFLYSEFIDNSNVDSYTGNTGLGMIQLAPKSKLKFKAVKLDKGCNIIKILEYKAQEGLVLTANGRTLKEDTTELTKDITELNCVINNPTDKYLEVNKVLLSLEVKELTKEEKLEARFATLEDKIEDMQSAINDILLGGM